MLFFGSTDICLWQTSTAMHYKIPSTLEKPPVLEVKSIAKSTPPTPLRVNSELRPGKLPSRPSNRLPSKATTWDNCPPIPAPLSPKSQSEKQVLTVSFEDVQKLQGFSERISELQVHLERNISIVRLLQTLNNRYHRATSSYEVDHAAFDDAFDVMLADLSLFKRNMDGLLHRVEGRKHLVLLIYLSARTL